MLLCSFVCVVFFFFFFNDTATTEIYTLSLHDALPICRRDSCTSRRPVPGPSRGSCRSEEHTSELQSRVDISYAVFCLKKKKTNYNPRHHPAAPDRPQTAPHIDPS